MPQQSDDHVYGIVDPVIPIGMDGDIVGLNSKDIVPALLKDGEFLKRSGDALVGDVLSTLIGEIKMWTTATPPAGWLDCDASAVSRTTYAALFAVIGTTFGAGDGSTTFNLPDFRGRSPIGVGTGDASDATAHALAAKSGTEKHTLTESEMPAHTHDLQTIAFSAGFGTAAIFDGSAATKQTGSVGADVAHNNQHPNLGIHFIIRT